MSFALGRGCRNDAEFMVVLRSLSRGGKGRKAAQRSGHIRRRGLREAWRVLQARMYRDQKLTGCSKSSDRRREFVAAKRVRLSRGGRRGELRSRGGGGGRRPRGTRRRLRDCPED